MSDDFEIVSIFHENVKQVYKPVLTEFCTKLTGITQDMVNEKPTFQEILEKFLWDLKTADRTVYIFKIVNSRIFRC